MPEPLADHEAARDRGAETGDIICDDVSRKAMTLTEDIPQPARSRPPREERLRLEMSEERTRGGRGRRTPETQKVG